MHDFEKQNSHPDNLLPLPPHTLHHTRKLYRYRRKLGRVSEILHCFSHRTLGQLLMDIHHETKRKVRYFRSTAILRQLPTTTPIPDPTVTIDNCHEKITLTHSAIVNAKNPPHPPSGEERDPAEAYNHKIELIRQRLIAMLKVKPRLQVQYQVYERVDPAGVYSTSNFIAGAIEIPATLINQLEATESIDIILKLIQKYAIFHPMCGEHETLPIMYASQIMSRGVQEKLTRIKATRDKYNPQYLYRPTSDLYIEYSTNCDNLYREATHRFLGLDKRVIVIQDIIMRDLFLVDPSNSVSFGMLDRETTDYAFFVALRQVERSNRRNNAKTRRGPNRKNTDTTEDNTDDDEEEDGGDGGGVEDSGTKRDAKPKNYALRAMLCMPRMWVEGEMCDTLKIQPDCGVEHFPVHNSTFQLTLAPRMSGFIQDRSVSRKFHTIHGGEPIMWLVMSARSRYHLESVLKSRMERHQITAYRNDPSMNDGYVFTLDFFRHNNIDVEILIQWPGECLILNEGTCAQSISLGANYCEFIELGGARGEFTKNMIAVQQSLLSPPSRATTALTLPTSLQPMPTTNITKNYRLVELNHELKCTCCGRTFPDSYTLIQHSKMMLNRLTCSKCQMSLPLYKLAEHTFGHFIDFSACYICKGIFLRAPKHIYDVHAVPLRAAIFRNSWFQMAYIDLLKTCPLLPKGGPEETRRRKILSMYNLFIFYS